MELTCPACRKLNTLAADSRECGRCGCDLDQLAHIATAARRYRQEAMQCLRAGDWPAALAQAERSWELRHTREAAQVACLAAAASRQGSALKQWRHWLGQCA